MRPARLNSAVRLLVSSSAGTNTSVKRAVHQHLAPKRQVGRAGIENVLAAEDDLLAPVARAELRERQDYAFHHLLHFRVHAFHLRELKAVEVARRGLEHAFHGGKRHKDGMAVPAPDEEVAARGLTFPRGFHDFIGAEIVALPPVCAAAPHLGAFLELLAQRDVVDESQPRVLAALGAPSDDHRFARRRLIRRGLEPRDLLLEPRHVRLDSRQFAHGLDVLERLLPAGTVEAQGVDAVAAGGGTAQVIGARLGVEGAV